VNALLQSVESEIGTAKYGNHYLLGKPPFSFEQYTAWPNNIACLPEPFDTNIVAQ
jgi:hypothetical protein